MGDEDGSKKEEHAKEHCGNHPHLHISKDDHTFLLVSIECEFLKTWADVKVGV